MKKVLITLIVSIFSTILIASNQKVAGQTFIDEIKTAFNNGDAAILSKHFSNNIDIAFNKDSGLYSKSQSEMIMRDFFSKEKSESFEIKQRSYQKDNELLYLISSYKSSKNKYLVFITFKWEANKYKIVEIHFKLI